LIGTASDQMRHGARLVHGTGGNVLLLSMRRLADLVGYCMTYEFEDVIAEVTGADRVDADDESALELSRRAYKLFRYATHSRRLARTLAVRPSVIQLQRNYDLFFPIFNHTHELYALATIPDWRKRCRFAACYVSELWLHLLPGYLVEQLADFDHIFLGVHHCLEEVARISGRPCSYLPLAADVLRFSPAPQFPAREIDVYNIGRRSQTTHHVLMRLAREREIFYSYDTVAASGLDRNQRTFRVQNASEHRLLLASMLQRSRYYFAHRARINEPSYTQGRDEMSGRFYEGAAAGAVMIGEPPRLDSFAQEFDWPDAVIRVPFDSPDIGEILAELDTQPERLARIRRNNVTNAALRHDWLHRIRHVFDTFHLPPTPGMYKREQRLSTLANMPEAAWPAESVRIHKITARRRPVISVVIPTHNRVGIVERALRSVARQTFEDYEVIVVDDGSSDATQVYLETMRSPRTRVIRNEKCLGVSVARNRGVAAASGDLITFLDDDDALRPTALARLHELMTSCPQLDFVWGGRLIHEMDAVGRSIGTREDDWSRIPKTLSGSGFLNLVLKFATSSAFTIRRTTFEALGGFDEQLSVSEDRDLFIALARDGYLGAALPQTIIDVHEIVGSLSRSTSLRSGANIDLRVIEKHREYLERPEHREFLASYLVAVFVGFLKAGNRHSAMRMLGELRRRGALRLGLLREYLRHAPEFRALKSWVRYDAIRRISNKLMTIPSRSR
jgi:glycosyltransferase involved in cell wall biosynthesis